MSERQILMLCHDTRDEIMRRLNDLLDGHYFSAVLCNSYSEDSDLFRSVEVHPSQVLTRPFAAYSDESLAGINWSISDLVMGAHNTSKTEREARDGGVHEYVRFDFQRDRASVHQYAPAGYRLLWVFTREHREWDLS